MLKKAKKNKYNRSSTIEDLPLLVHNNSAMVRRQTATNGLPGWILLWFKAHSCHCFATCPHFVGQHKGLCCFSTISHLLYTHYWTSTSARWLYTHFHRWSTCWPFSQSRDSEVLSGQSHNAGLSSISVIYRMVGDVGLLGDISTGVFCQFVPVAFCNVFSAAMHCIHHPGVCMVNASYCWTKMACFFFDFALS